CFCPLICYLVFFYCSVGSSSPRLEMNTPISAMNGKGQAPVTKYLANHRALGTLVASS
uniref:Uncharacterized protein n=1 Tax=Triticum urartu TaxID=4572 RepID=A0A8R7P290_TRIUA